MEYTHLGRTGLRVSRLCLGTMNFGPNTEEKEAFRIMDCALEAGINFFDTANMYGGRSGGYRGWTEEIIGKWFAQGAGRRERVVLATKIFEGMNNPIDGPNGDPGLSAFKIRRHTEDCLRRLRTDHVELLYMHNPEPHAPWEELWAAFERLSTQGKIDYVGSSNFAAYQLAAAQAKAEERHFLGIVCDQSKYNLMARLPELELIPACREMGIGFLAWSPLQGGLLSGSILRGIESGQRSSKYENSISPELTQRLKKYRGVCAEFGMTEAEASLVWLLSRPGLTAPLVGPRNVEQLEDMVRISETKLPEELAKQLEQLFPGPIAQAPAAYSRS